jgi:DNA-binding transcriptional MerR regulator
MTAAGLPAGSALSIGAVLTRLKSDFPDISISKIRFLESEGLVTPERTPSGYRQFSPRDVERLRYVLAAQRDHYLPLKVIREQLDAIDRGLEPATPAARVPRTLVVAPAPALGDLAEPSATVRLTRIELLAESGLSTTELREIEEYGLVAPGPGGWYDAEAVLLAGTVAELVAAGLEPRHLRQFRVAADRESSLVSQLVAASARQKDPDARERADAEAAQLASVVLRLHSLLVKAGLRRELGR